MAQRARHYNRNMGPKTWKKWTDWPLMVLSVVFLVVYSWEILSRTHIALCETVINVIWVVFVVDYVVSLWLADDRWRWFKHNLFTLCGQTVIHFHPFYRIINPRRNPKII